MYLPHSSCLLGDRSLIWSFAISHSLTTASYFAIPIGLLIALQQNRASIPAKHVNIVILFAAFILGCGCTHAMSVIEIWLPWYRIHSAVNAFTAFVSVVTAIVFLPISLQGIQLAQDATKDPVLGISNRRYAEEWLKQAVEAHTRSGTPLAILLIDMDGLKAINDHRSGGHKAGDYALKTISDYLQQHVRKGDLLSRWNLGDEFCIAMPTADVDDAESRAEELRSAIAELDVIWNRIRFPVSVSIGVAVHPHHGATVEDLIGKADRALYQAKEQGRDRVVVAG